MSEKDDIQCRVCIKLNKTDLCFPLNLKQIIYEREISLREIIKQCCFICIEEDSQLPQQICKFCVENAKIAFKFLIQCQQAEIHYRKINESLKSIHDEINFTCNWCNKTYKNEIEFDSHVCTKSSSDIEYVQFKEVCQSNSINGSLSALEIKLNLKKDNFVNCYDECEDSIDDVQSLDEDENRENDNNERNSECKSKVGVEKENIAIENNTTSDNTSPNVITEIKKYKCLSCNTRFKGSVDFMKHCQTHKEIKCHICPSIFPSHIQFRNHMKVHTKEDVNKRTCDICYNVLTRRCTMLEHKRTVHKEIIQKSKNQNDRHLKCLICDETFTKIKDRLEHQKTHNELKCTRCPSEFNTKKKLLKHIWAQHTNLELEKRSCDICFKVFKTRTSMQIHYRKFHSKRQNNVPKNRENDNNERNSECKSKVGAEKENVAIENNTTSDNNTSSNVITEIKKYKCLSCNTRFKGSVDFMKHCQTHKEFKCHICPSIFPSHIQFRNHMKVHTKEDVNKRTCDICYKVLTRRCTMLEHKRTVHKDIIQKSKKQNDRHLKCLICDETFTKIKDRLEHQKTHNELKCNRCPSEFNTKKKLLKHIWAQHTNLELEKRFCDICFKVFKNRTSMQIHYRKFHSKRQNNVPKIKSPKEKKCKHCGDAVIDMSLYQHMDAVHQELKNFVCNECGKRFFGKKNLNNHIFVHRGIKPYMCDICGRSFALQNNLKTHMRIHTGEKPYKCRYCDKAFVQQRERTSHEITHTGKKDYVCPICGKAYGRLGALRMHERKHKEEKSFKCNVCERMFFTNGLLKAHLVTHTDKKDFVCDTCGKEFNRNSNLVVHKRIHTRETPFVCSTCGKGFTQNHCLKNHICKNKTSDGNVSNEIANITSNK